MRTRSAPCTSAVALDYAMAAFWVQKWSLRQTCPEAILLAWRWVGLRLVLQSLGRLQGWQLPQSLPRLCTTSRCLRRRLPPSAFQDHFRPFQTNSEHCVSHTGQCMTARYLSLQKWY